MNVIWAGNTLNWFEIFTILFSMFGAINLTKEIFRACLQNNLNKLSIKAGLDKEAGRPYDEGGG